MKRQVIYESDKILPLSMELNLLHAQEYIMADRNEPDKMLAHFSWLKRCVTDWFYNHSNIYKEEV
jgi:hypothetical protein